MCASAIVRPNLQLYRDSLAVHEELHRELQGERPARWPCCLSWHVLMWLGTINTAALSAQWAFGSHAHRLAPRVIAQTGYAASAVLARELPPSKPCELYSTVLWLENSFLTLLAVERVKCQQHEWEQAQLVQRGIMIT